MTNINLYLIYTHRHFHISYGCVRMCVCVRTARILKSDTYYQCLSTEFTLPAVFADAAPLITLHITRFGVLQRMNVLSVCEGRTSFFFRATAGQVGTIKCLHLYLKDPRQTGCDCAPSRETRLEEKSARRRKLRRVLWRVWGCNPHHPCIVSAQEFCPCDTQVQKHLEMWHLKEIVLQIITPESCISDRMLQFCQTQAKHTATSQQRCAHRSLSSS